MFQTAIKVMCLAYHLIFAKELAAVFAQQLATFYKPRRGLVTRVGLFAIASSLPVISHSSSLFRSHGNSSSLKGGIVFFKKIPFGFWKSGCTP